MIRKTAEVEFCCFVVDFLQFVSWIKTGLGGVSQEVILICFLIL